MRLRLRPLVTTVVVPLLAGATLAAFCVLAGTALGSQGSANSHDLSVLGSSQEHGAAAAGHGREGAKGRYEQLVASAAAHEVGAEQSLVHAQRLRSEAVTAESKAAALQSSLAQLLDEEASRDRAAARLAGKAQALEQKAKRDVFDQRSLRTAWNEQLAAAEAKHGTFLQEEKAANEDKAAAKMLLNQERKLFEKSFDMVNKEAKAQTEAHRADQKLTGLRKRENNVQDREHLAVEVQQQQKQTLQQAEEQAEQQSAKKPSQQANAHPHASTSSRIEREESADKTAEARLKRPLWGDRKWPSYYDNALTDPGSQKLFKADEPSHPAPRQLEMGDDNQAFDHPRPGADTAVPMPKPANPARMQAMYQMRNTGRTAFSTNARMGLPPPPRHQLAETGSFKHPSVAPSILKKFEGDVQKMEQPVIKLEGRLEQTLARMHARRAHRQALHLYNTDTESWRELSRKAEHERAKRVADAAAESRDLVNDMNQAMGEANHKMKTEMRETNDSMKRELQDVVEKFQAEGRGKVSKAEHEAIAETEARQREMGEVMSEYVHHERDVNDKLRAEMRDLVESSAHQKADMISEAEHWKMAEEAKYKHEMEAQVKQAEMKVDQARSEAAMALHAAQHDASAGSRERLHAAEEHEQHALRVLSKAELEERQQARAYQREASEEHARVKALEDQLEHFEAQHQLRKEVLAERRRERERMEDRFEMRQRQEARKDAMLEEQVKDARSVAEKEREAALARAKQLAVERVKRQALRAEAHERARLQAAEDLAEQRKAEAQKEKRLAAKEAAQLRLEQQHRMQQRRRQLTGPTPAAAAAARER